ncbi:MAG TPA: helix-turn-helix domain-containing protein [Pyrinomonadaceae bacterium]|nr:helix-turn-helix domain-containing protein [Pyrinomonadaceae bacterium]
MKSTPSSGFLQRSSDVPRLKHINNRSLISEISSSNGISTVRFKKQTVADARISSLKILALSLLKRIESLEEQSSVETLTDLDLQAEVRCFEAELIRNALIRTGGRQRRAAHLLGMKVTTLNSKIKRYQITLDESPVHENGSHEREEVS